MWRGRGELDIVNQVEVIDHWRAVREDLAALGRGLTMLEVVDQLAQEGQPDPRLYAMLVGALRALADPDLDPTLVPASFFLKALVLEGAAPVLDGCASCGRSDTEVELVAFDLSEGGRAVPELPARSSDERGRARSSCAGSSGASWAPRCGRRRRPGHPNWSPLATAAMEAHLDRRLRSVHSAPGP